MNHFATHEELTTVTSHGFKRNIGAAIDAARRGPVLITGHGRPQLVVVGIKDYEEPANTTEGEAE